MRIAVGADHRGYSIHNKVVELLQKLGHDVVDMGTYGDDPVDYPDIAAKVRAFSGQATRPIKEI